MGRLCIVSRDSPTLPGYLMVVLDKEIRSPDGLDLIFDRRHNPGTPRPAGGEPTERRQSPGIEAELESRGFAIVGMNPAGPARRRWAPDRWRRRVPPGRMPRVSISRRTWLASLTIAAVIGGAAAAAYAVLTITPDQRTRIFSTIAAWKRIGAEFVPMLERQGVPPASAPDATEPAPRVDAPASTPLAETEPGPPPRGASPTRGPARALPPAGARSEPASRPESTSHPDTAPRQSSGQRQDPAAGREDPPASRETPAVTLPPARRTSPGLTPPPVRRDPASPTATTRRETPDSASPAEPPRVLTGSDGAVPRSQAARRGSTQGATGVSQPESAASAPAGRTRSAKAPSPPRVELEAQPVGADAERAITYTARLWDANGRPIENAAVTLHGWMPNGNDLQAALGSTPTPGTYRGTATVGPATPGNLRVRVVHEGARFEIPSGR